MITGEHRFLLLIHEVVPAGSKRPKAWSTIDVTSHRWLEADFHQCVEDVPPTAFHDILHLFRRRTMRPTVGWRMSRHRLGWCAVHHTLYESDAMGLNQLPVGALDVV